MRASTWTLPLFALLATGCGRMPEDPVFIYGQVAHADGSPAGGTVLHVERAKDPRAGTVNTPYGQNEHRWLYEPYSEGTAESSGSFTLEAVSGDLYSEGYFADGYYGFTEHRFRVYPPLAEDGSGVFVAFVFRDDVELPLLRPWATGLTVGDGPSLAFSAAPPVPEQPPSAQPPLYWLGTPDDPITVHPSTPVPVVQLVSGGGLLWQQVGASSPWAPGPYVLEDFEGVEAQVRAASVGQWQFEPLGGEYSTLTFRMEWRGPHVALPGGLLRPVSRGATCSPNPVAGPCPYTDGKLENVVLRPMREGDTSEPGEPSLTVSLAEPTRLRRVVVRHLETTLDYQARIKLVLEGSTDGLTWTPLGSFPLVLFDNSDPSRNIHQFSLTGTDNDSPFDRPMDLWTPPVFLDAPLSGETPVRHVRLRVRSEDGTLPGKLWSLEEVSLFQ